MGQGGEMPHSDRSPPPGFLASAGELGRLIEAVDWSATPLGPLDAWPQSLRTAVSLILNARHPMWIGWGKEATFLYNDAYVDVLGAAKHPWALGRPASEVWSEIWDVCGPLADKVFQRAEATFVEAVQLFMRRGDFLEETWYSFSYSPIVGEDGQVGGLFCPSTDVSASVLNARRLGTLSRLSADALREPTVAGACATAIGTLADNPADLPFVLLYVADADGTLRLRGTAGLAAADAFPVAQACRDSAAVLVDLMLRRIPAAAYGAGLSSLTPREQETLSLIASGLSNQEIAKTLFLSEKTVKFHVSNLLGKLGLRNRSQAIVYARDSGVPLPG